ncbi:MAG: hypothetical protein LQ349_006016 [Xanthoria aureola]|nr:MAG: hypothetical protein LQ349_006016 [Xanthoria aureola]
MASPPFHVKAIYEYSSPHDDDLSFSVGQVITVTEQEGDDWYFGEYEEQSGNKKEGLFPRNFVKNYEPETPPRPTRPSRAKKETESSAPSQESRSAAQPAAAVASPRSEDLEFTAKPLQEKTTGTAEPTKAIDQSSGTSRVQAEPKSAPSASSKPAPPPASGSGSVEKPSSGSFRDRINAFNKPAAPPVAPTKPSGLGASGGSGFVKKAFVAPPPSKNAYVPLPREAPPQRIYNREEQLEAEAQLEPTDESEPTTQPITQQSGVPAGGENDQPKPTSLKERIALLQKQQMEQAARHTEAAQKKEKPKRPPPKRMESQDLMFDSENTQEDDSVQRIDSGEGLAKQPGNVPRVLTDPRSESTARDPESSEITPVVSPAGHPRQTFSDGNDADVSGAADTEEDMPPSRDQLDQRSQAIAQRPSHRLPDAPIEQQEVGEKQIDDAEDEEDEEVDPEVRKRMEIRERMAKMSGGMGMAGMFGPPGGMASMPPRRQIPSSSERKTSGNERSATGESVSSRAPPVPMMPMPGLTKVRSPEQDATSSAQVSKEEENDVPMSITQGRTPMDMPDVEDLKEEPVLPSRRSTDRQLPPPMPYERPAPPPPPSKAREAPPLPPTGRPVPPPPQAKSEQPPPSGQPMSPSEGSESDDEMSVHARRQSLRVPTSDESRPVSREGPPPVPLNGPPPTLPSRPRAPPVEIPPDAQSVDFASKETSPTSPSTPSVAAKRLSRPPPIPGSAPAVPPPTPQTRAPPPPPPGAPPSRVATGEMRSPPPVPKAPTSTLQDSDEEVTEYEGDYDTDIAPGASHKAALKAHSKEPTRDSNSDMDSGHDAVDHSGVPPLGPAPSVPPRAVPPLPPSQAPKGPRQSTEIPRGAPPPPPPTKEQPFNSYEKEGAYDPYIYSMPSQRVTPATDRGNFEQPTPSRADDQDDLYSASPPRRNVPPSPAMSSSQYASPPSLPASSRSAPRHSLDVQRNSTSGRRSMDAPRVSSDHGFMAGDLELDPGIQWWTQPNMPPPVLQNRRDVIYETEDSTTTRRGGRQAITRNVYALYMDYSQTIIAAHFEARDPSEASLEQHHEPPPPRLRQDQLEDAHTRFGTRIAEGASSKKDTVVGDGSPNALVLDLMASLPDALRPVGLRAYGALVYANLANASVQQFDEIRAGDIVTFRNAKFQGHRGPMKSKYSGDVGKPDHVAVVVDWDGTKKKVRAWEQGRESKKVKLESFKLGDMKSGEVKVWRVMARQWVGWE